MNFDWTTFLLEIFNFLILLWILRRFLYHPIQAVVRTRQEQIGSVLDNANQRQREAEETLKGYEQRLAEWEMEKSRAHRVLDQEIAEERERRLAAITDEIAEIKARNQAREQYEQQERQRLQERQALGLAGQFVSRLVGELATPELEQQLIVRFLAGLPQLSPADYEMLTSSLREEAIELTSAFPLPKELEKRLTDELSGLAQKPLVLNFSVDALLMAGLRLQAGSCVLAANLRDELKFFVDLPTATGLPGG